MLGAALELLLEELDARQVDGARATAVELHQPTEPVRGAAHDAVRREVHALARAEKEKKSDEYIRPAKIR